VNDKNHKQNTPGLHEYKLRKAKSQTKSQTPGPQEYKLCMAKLQTKKKETPILHEYKLLTVKQNQRRGVSQTSGINKE